MPQLESFRPLGGDIFTLALGATDTFTVPGNAREIMVTASMDFGRVLVSRDATPPAVTDQSYGYLKSDIPITIKLVQGRDQYIHFSSTVADNVITVTYGN